MTTGAEIASQPRLSRLRAILDRSMWGYRRRLFPMATFLAFAAVGCALAMASRLDAPIESTTLAVVLSLPLSVVFVDAAAPITTPSVVSLAWRRALPALLGATLASSMWMVARLLAAAFRSGLAPDRWALLEWATICASQLALGAVTAWRRPDSVSFGPAILVGLVWYLVVAAPRLHQTLFDPVDHRWVWLSLLASFAFVVCVGSRDPARRPRRGIHT